MDTDFAGIAAEDTVVVDIAVVGIKKDDTEPVLIEVASSHHFPLSRYPPSFPVVDEVLCSFFHHDLLIYKIYNTD